MKQLKPIRLLIFFAATISLAKFFEAGRLIADDGSFAFVPMSILSLLALVFFVFVLGYWVYEDEKEKNNLRVRFGIYEWVYKILRKEEK